MIQALVRVTMALAAVGVMYLESRYQPTPGVGFGLGLVLLLGAAIPWRHI